MPDASILRAARSGGPRRATASDEMVLTGPIGQGSAEIRLRRLDTEHAPLMTRGFRRIQEAPHNR